PALAGLEDVPRGGGLVDHVLLLSWISWPHPVLFRAEVTAQHGGDGDRARAAEAQRADPDAGCAGRDQAGGDGGVTGEGDRIDSVEVGGAALIVAEGRFRVA